MEDPWLHTVLNMLGDVPWCCPTIKDLIVDVLVGHALKSLPYLHLMLCSEMCITQTGVLFLSLSGSGRGKLSVYVEGLPAVLEGIGRLVC